MYTIEPHAHTCRWCSGGRCREYPKPQAPSPKPEARSPKPEALNPKPEARNPKPEPVDGALAVGAANAAVDALVGVALERRSNSKSTSNGKR